jgi:hypothetical protein
MDNSESGDRGATIYRYRDCQRCGSSPNFHPVRHIEHDRLRACIDVEIAELVLTCWQAGIATNESCQDYTELPGRPARASGPLVALSLPTAAAERFANAVLHTGDVALYERMFVSDAPDRWAVPMVYAGVWRYRPGTQIRVALRVHYLFPRAEVPLLTSRVRAWSASGSDRLAAADRGPEGPLPIVVPMAPERDGGG